jgi:hypothetical protein
MYYGFVSAMDHGRVYILKSIIPNVERSAVITHVNSLPIREYLARFAEYFGNKTHI